MNKRIYLQSENNIPYIDLYLHERAKKESIVLVIPGGGYFFCNPREGEDIAYAFLAKGFDKTTMDDVAKEAQYSKATLYVYFKSKDEILNYLTLESMKQLYAHIHEGMKKGIYNVLFNESGEPVDNFYAIVESQMSRSDYNNDHDYAIMEYIMELVDSL